MVKWTITGRRECKKEYAPVALLDRWVIGPLLQVVIQLWNADAPPDTPAAAADISAGRAGAADVAVSLWSSFCGKNCTYCGWRPVRKRDTDKKNKNGRSGAETGEVSTSNLYYKKMECFFFVKNKKKHDSWYILKEISTTDKIAIKTWYSLRFSNVEVSGCPKKRPIFVNCFCWFAIWEKLHFFFYKDQ